jgi:hypothetical protein
MAVAAASGRHELAAKAAAGGFAMERFVIGAALFAAVAIAAGGYFGHAISDGDGFRFEIDGDRDSGGGDVRGTGAASSVPAAVYVAEEIRIRNAVAVLKVITEDRADVSVEIANPGVLATPRVRLEGDELIVDGGIGSRRIRSCHREGAFAPEVSGVGIVNAAQAPVITVRAPKTLKLAVGGAVESDVGPSNEANLSFAGCGNARVGDVAGKLEVDTSGSGNVTGGTAQAATISIAGSGEATIGAVAGALEADVAGSGGVTAASVGGPLEVYIAGSGGVVVNGGAMGDTEVSVAGSGDVTIAGNVQRLEVSIAGSGDVEIKGKATSVDASIMGSGDVIVAEVSGGVEKSVMGSGSVTIGRN